jgi:hypothetical protein
MEDLLKNIGFLVLCLLMMGPLNKIEAKTKKVDFHELPVAQVPFSSLVLTSEQFRQLGPEDRTTYFISLLALAQIYEASQDLVDVKNREIRSSARPPLQNPIPGPQKEKQVEFNWFHQVIPEAHGNPLALVEGLLWLRGGAFVAPKVISAGRGAAIWTARSVQANQSRAAARGVLAAANKKSLEVAKGLRSKADDVMKEASSKNTAIRAKAEQEVAQNSAKAEETAELLRKNAERSEQIAKIRLKEGTEGVAKFFQKEREALLAKRAEGLIKAQREAAAQIQKQAKQIDQLEKRHAAELKKSKPNQKVLGSIEKQWYQSLEDLESSTRKFKQNGGQVDEASRIMKSAGVTRLPNLAKFKAAGIATTTGTSAKALGLLMAGGAAFPLLPDSTKDSLFKFFDEAGGTVLGIAGIPDAKGAEATPTTPAPPSEKTIGEAEDASSASESCLFGLYTKTWNDRGMCSRPEESSTESCYGDHFQCPSFGLAAKGQPISAKSLCLDTEPILDISVRCSGVLTKFITDNGEDIQLSEEEYRAFAQVLRDQGKKIEGLDIKNLGTLCNRQRQNDECDALKAVADAIPKAAVDLMMAKLAKDPEDAGTQ